MRWVTVAALLVLCGMAVTKLNSLRTDVSFRDFFPEKDPEYQFHQELTQLLGSADEIIRIAIPADSGLYQTAYLEQLSALTATLDTMQNVRRATSIATVRKPIWTPLGIHSTPYIRLTAARSLYADSVRIALDEPFTTPYMTADGRAGIIVLQPDEKLGHSEMAGLIGQVSDACSHHFPGGCRLGGLTYLEANYARMSRRSVFSVAGFSIVFILVTLVILFRSATAVVYPALAIAMAAVIFLGYMALIDRPLGIMASLFPTLILIVGVSDVIHLLSRYDSILAETRESRAALHGTLKEIGIVLMMTSGTTAIGLLTFVQSNMRALQQFGYDAAAAVLITFVVTIGLAPAMLTLHRNPDAPILRPVVRRVWNTVGRNVSTLCSTRGGLLISIAAALTMFSIVGLIRVNTNSRLAFRFSGNDSLAKDIEFFDSRLGGIRTLQLAVIAKPGQRLNRLSTLNEIRAVHEHLESEPLFTNVVSPVTFYQGLHRLWRPYVPSGLDLPDSDDDIRRYEVRASSLEHAMPIRLVDRSRTIGLIAATYPDMGRHDAARLGARVDKWIENNVDSSLVSFRQTGTSYLIDRGHQHRISNMFVGLAIAVLAVAVIMALILRDPRVLIVALVVNLLPLAWAGGMMGWLGIELRGATSAIFAIGFVIAVDDTLHILSAFAYRTRRGASVDLAIHQALVKTGRGVVTTSLVLFGGFMVLTAASFWEIYVFGWLVSLLLVMALLTDLLLLPVLLRWLKSNAKHSS